ncbi:MAG: peptidase S7 [Bacillota bacterium]
MYEIKGIAKEIVKRLVEKSNHLGEGRSVGTIAFLDDKNYISSYNKIISGGLSGLPYRLLLSDLTTDNDCSLIEMINQLPENAVIISTDPGETGIIVNTGGINIFNLPVVKVGVKNGSAVGVGVLYPEKKNFQLASKSEKAQLDSLAALTMEEERQALKTSTEIKLKYLHISGELPIVSLNKESYKVEKENFNSKRNSWKMPRNKVKSVDEDFAQKLVDKSINIEQGREVAAFGKINKDGHVVQASELVVGGMGYIPPRLLASSYADINDISLREAYTKIIDENTAIVHTHPGGTGVMHMNDAMAGPGMWGRPIMAIGHNKKGKIKGVSVIELTERLCELADENEELEQKFFKADTPEEEVTIRKRRYKIAQEFTDLCKQVKLK